MLNSSRKGTGLERKLLSSKLGKNLDNLLFKFLFFIFKLIPIDDNKITIVSFHHNYLYGNTKAIYKTIKEEGLSYSCKLIFKQDTEFTHAFSIAKLLKKIRIAYLYNTSRFIFLDDYYGLLSQVKFKNKIKIIQLWHGTGAFKKIGLARQNMTKQQKEISEKVASQYTAVIASSTEVVPVLSESYGVSEHKILALGSPKSDIFFNQAQIDKIQESFFNKYNQFTGKKIILYAPTYRDNARERDLELDINLLKEQLESKNYILLLKLHHLERKKLKLDKGIKNFAYDLSNEDIDSLLITADILITDYSSLIFEYAVLNKPTIFFAYDLEEYDQQTRGFYYPYIEFVPGPIAKTTEEILELIQKNKWNLNQQKEFTYRFITNQGNAAKAVVDRFLK